LLVGGVIGGGYLLYQEFWTTREFTRSQTN